MVAPWLPGLLPTLGGLLPTGLDAEGESICQLALECWYLCSVRIERGCECQGGPCWGHYQRKHGNKLERLQAASHNLACKGHPNLFDFPLSTAAAKQPCSQCLPPASVGSSDWVEGPGSDSVQGLSPPHHAIWPACLPPWHHTPPFPYQALASNSLTSSRPVLPSGCVRCPASLIHISTSCLKDVVKWYQPHFMD